VSEGARLLEEQLRAQPPSAILELDDEHLRDLAAAVREARHRQAAELARAGDKALGLIPRMLRGPVRRMLG
jgi:hypothetical protein